MYDKMTLKRWVFYLQQKMIKIKKMLLYALFANITFLRHIATLKYTYMLYVYDILLNEQFSTYKPTKRDIKAFQYIY